MIAIGHLMNIDKKNNWEKKYKLINVREIFTVQKVHIKCTMVQKKQKQNPAVPPFLV